MAKPKRDSQVAAAILPGQTPVLDKMEARKLNPPMEKPKVEEFHSIASKLAQSNFCCRNWKFKNADKHFPVDVVSRRVSIYFKNAQGGELLVDEPKNDRELAICKRKAEIILAEGQRYVYIRKAKDDEDDQKILSEAKEQLKKHDEALSALREAKAS
jgi:hypothetical protein